jgi:hypothetical protein
VSGRSCSGCPWSGSRIQGGGAEGWCEVAPILKVRVCLGVAATTSSGDRRLPGGARWQGRHLGHMWTAGGAGGAEL